MEIVAFKLTGLRVIRSSGEARPGYIICGTQWEIKMEVFIESMEVNTPRRAALGPGMGKRGHDRVAYWTHRGDIPITLLLVLLNIFQNPLSTCDGDSHCLAPKTLQGSWPHTHACDLTGNGGQQKNMGILPTHPPSAWPCCYPG